jgi:hypothetical protein
MALIDNLVSYWSLEDATDAHGARDLTNNGTVTFVTGKVANAGDFESTSSQYLSHADHADLRMGDIDFSIACWVYFESKTAFRTFVSKCSNAVNKREYLLDFDSGAERIRFSVSSAGTSFTTRQASTLGTPVINTWYFVVARHDATNNTISICVNDGTVDSVAHSGGAFTSDIEFRIGAAVAVGGTPNYHDGLIDEVGIWKRLLTSAEITELYNSGNGRDYAYISGGSPTAYTLTADSGTFTLTGQDAALRSTRTISAAQGSYTLSGQDTGLLAARRLALTQASYTLSGQAATLTRGGLTIQAAVGRYWLTHPSVVRLENGDPLQLEDGSFVLDENVPDVTFTVQRRMTAAQATYTLAGQDATLRRGWRMTASHGAYTLAGQVALLRRGWTLTAVQATYTLAGQDAALRSTLRLAAEQGSYTLAGQSANLLTARLLTATQASYALTGQDAGLLRGYPLVAEVGTFALSGQDAALRATRRLVAAQATFALTGIDAALVYEPLGAYTMVAELGTHAITGSDTGLYATRQLAAEQSSYTLSAQDAALAAARYLAAAYDAYTLTGQAVTLRRGWRIQLAGGAFVLSGQAVALLIARQMLAAQATYTLTGHSATLVAPFKPIVDTPIDRIFWVVAEDRTFVIDQEDRTFVVTGG